MHEQLNKKLAEWAGLDWTITFEFEDEHGYCLPFFTDSLDACFKWLVPRVRELDTNLKIVLETQGAATRVAIYGSNPADDDFPTKILARSFEETPALALCLAIEKLIK